MINYEKELNAEQLTVVRNGDGACLVLAGAGSGKTRTITYRVAYLLEQGVKPEEILLVTFTNKASREMTERVSALVGGNIKLPWAGTFHHIAYKILRQYAPVLGYKNNLTILDSDDSKDLLKLCVKVEGVDRNSKRFPSPAVIGSIISFARNAERTIEDVLDEKYPNWLDIADKITRIAEEYKKRKQQANVMDFDDLLVNLYLLLLESPNTKKKFAEQCKYILVDEYQDTNKIQASIIDQFAAVHKNILVVGDDAQSIYSFRAADIQHILDFSKRYPGARVYKLETNYRSTPDILSLANDVISRNREQYEKQLRSVMEAFIKPEVHVFSDQQEEAQFIATRMLALRDEGVPLQQMAVLFRASFHSQALEMELARRDIPYDYRGGVRFFERSHIKDVLAFLRIVNNMSDEIAWSRILHMQVGIGPATAQKIIHEVRIRILSTQKDATTYEEQIEQEQTTMSPHFFDGIGGSLSARAQIGWNDFLQIWQKIAIAPKTAADLILAVINSKYKDYLEAEYPDYRDRLQDIDQLAVFASQQDDLQVFLAEATLQEQYRPGKKGRDSHNTDDTEKVILSTIHQAKGLEWEVVFVIGMSQGNFPNDRALKERQGLEEERRLFYVAVTRAKKQLYLSYSLSSMRSLMMNGPSMFLEELDKRLIDEYHFGGLNQFSQPSSVFFDPSDEGEGVEYISEDAEFESPKKKRPGSFLIDTSDW